MFRLDKKVAMITGGGSGIGRVFSLLFAQQGATVCILDLDEQGGAAVATEISRLMIPAFFIRLIFYSCAHMKLLLSRVAITRLMEVFLKLNT